MTALVIQIVCSLLMMTGLVVLALRQGMTSARKSVTKGLAIATIAVSLIGLVSAVVFFTSL